mgnify:CR=1 FL=1
MQRFKLFIATLALLVLPVLPASAQIADAGGSGGAFQGLLANILVFTNQVLIPFIIGIGFLVFVWGMFQYFIAGGANDESKEKGKSLMIYATLGFLLIIVFWGVINLLATSTGLNNENINFLVPAVTPIPA